MRDATTSSAPILMPTNNLMDDDASTASTSSSSQQPLSALSHEQQLLRSLLRFSSHVDVDVELPNEARDQRLTYGRSRADIHMLLEPQRVLASNTKEAWMSFLGNLHFSWRLLPVADMLQSLATTPTELGDNELSFLAGRFRVAEATARVLREFGQLTKEVVKVSEACRRCCLTMPLDGSCIVEPRVVGSQWCDNAGTVVGEQIEPTQKVFFNGVSVAFV